MIHFVINSFLPSAKQSREFSIVEIYAKFMFDGGNFLKLVE